MSALLSLSESNLAVRLVIFFSYATFGALNTTRPQIYGLTVSLPVPVVAFGVVRVVAQIGALVVPLQARLWRRSFSPKTRRL